MLLHFGAKHECDLLGHLVTSFLALVAGLLAAERHPLVELAIAKVGVLVVVYLLGEMLSESLVAIVGQFVVADKRLRILCGRN